MSAAPTIHGAALAIADTQPSAPFVTVVRKGCETMITYADLAHRSRDYASEYQRRGVGKGNIVAIMVPHSPELFPAFLGAMAIGAIPAFFPTLSPKQDPAIFWSVHDAVFQHIRARLLLTDAEGLSPVREALPAHAHLAVSVAEVCSGSNRVHETANVCSDDVAFLQHSSGTTGLKKGVQLTHRAVLRQVDAYAATLGLSAHDRIATWLPLYHDMGLIACFMLPLVKRVPVVALDPFEWVVQPTSLLDAIERHGCTLTWLPNFAFHHIVHTVRPGGRWRLESMRAFIDCSEPCKPDTFDLFHKTFTGMGLRRDALQVCYAMAENVFAVTQTDLSAPARTIAVDRDALLSGLQARPPSSGRTSVRLLSCGRPIPTARVAIAGPDGQPAPEGHVGQVLVGGESLFSGYHNRATATDALRGEWYWTGDLGFLSSGELYVTGRTDDLLIINGKNVYAHDVEHAINLHTAVKAGRCVALGIFNKQTGSEELTVVAEVGGDEAGVRAELKRRIGEVVFSEIGVALTTARFVEPGWLVKTTSGKVSRRANHEKYLRIM